MQKYAIIVAGGSGMRMGADIPKQFLNLAGRPVLMHTIEVFAKTDGAIRCIVVLPESQQIFWKSLCEIHSFKLPHQIVNGGDTRFQSVRNGLEAIPTEEGLVAIHDGVRPFVSTAIIEESYTIAAAKTNAIAAVASKDSLREVSGTTNRAVERSAYRIIQTPQTFQLGLLKKAFAVKEEPFFTDDASVFEFAGHTIHLIEGSYRNIKITTPEDMMIGETLMKASHS